MLNKLAKLCGCALFSGQLRVNRESRLNMLFHRGIIRLTESKQKLLLPFLYAVFCKAQSPNYGLHKAEIAFNCYLAVIPRLI